MLRVHVDAGSASRIGSLLLVALYAIASHQLVGGRAMAEMLAFSIIPLACIWFPQGLGDRTGPARGGYLKASPAGAVLLVGWLLLLAPLGYAVVNS